MDIQVLVDGVEEERLVERLITAVSIPSATGSEGPMGAWMADELRGLGFDVVTQEVEEGRRNVIGTLPGLGGGPSLMFNGHMDTSYSGEEPWLAGISGFQPEGFAEDGHVFGLGAANMKGALCAYLEALQAIQERGVGLRGDVLIAAVVGEIEKTQWGEEFSGRKYRGYAAGSRDLVAHGGVADYCILGEPTTHKIVLAHFGSMWVRLSTSGPFIHTAFTAGREAENSIARMQDVLEAVQEWIPSWRQEMSHEGVEAMVNIGAVRGGMPWRVSRTPHRTDLFLDLRVPPRVPMARARGRYFDFVRDLQQRYPEYGVSAEVFLSAPGAEIADGDPLVAAVERGHEAVFGHEAERDVVHWFSDASALTRYGITSVNYGTASGLPSAEKGENVEVKGLVNAAQVYAVAAAEICEVGT